MALLDLPNELIIQIVSNLTHRDLVACQLSNKLLHAIIKDSILLQFQVALTTFKATDNPSCPLSLSERFQALNDSEDAWSYLHIDFKRNIAINYDVSGIYDLTGGVFLLGNLARTALYYIQLPSSSGDGIEWRTIQLDHSEGMIIDMGFCLYEHDLLVVVTTKPRHDESHVITYDIRLVLFKLSTGQPHPAAKESTILVINSQWERPGIGVEIVGDRLVLILSYHNNHWMPHDRVFVYDWRNAVQKMSFAAPYCSYSGLVFLSEDLVAIPNARTNVLEIWDISSTPRTPSCILQLPELVPGNILVYITCRGEPNPTGGESRLASHRPFYHSSHDAIILFHIRVQLGDPLGHQQQHGGELVLGLTYSLFVHRKALCEVYERHCAEMNNKPGESLGMPDVSGQSEDSRFEDTGSDEMIVDDDDDDDDDWESVGSDNEDDIPLRVTSHDPIPIPWSSWGPPITRWFSADTNSTRWITTTSGQRGVLIGQSRRGLGHRYVVLDFNPENLQRMERRVESSRPMIETRIRCHRGKDKIEIAGVFKCPIVSELPFVSCTSERVYAWSGALMDEERVLGIKLDGGGHIKVIEVHHLGEARG